MAVLALADSLPTCGHASPHRVGYSRAGTPVTAEEIEGAGAMAAILRDALEPNLLQTLEGTPCSSTPGRSATSHGQLLGGGDLVGIRGSDFLITEAGFGADMGAERFFNIKCRASGLVPDAAVLVATVRSLKAHSGHHRIVAGRPLPPALFEERPDEVHVGGANLAKQVENVRLHGVPVVVAINAFPTDHPSEHRAIREIAAALGVPSALCTNVADGGKGALELAAAVDALTREPSDFRYLYDDDMPSPTRSRPSPRGSTGERRRVLGSGSAPDGRLRAQRARAPLGVYRQDPPLDLVGSGLLGAPTAGRCRCARCGRRSGRASSTHLRQHADDAGPRRAPRGVRDRHRRAGEFRRPVLSGWFPSTPRDPSYTWGAAATTG